MSNSENTFKLPEQIGKGINKEHLEKVMNERNKDAMVSFRLEGLKNERFDTVCDSLDIKKTTVLRFLVDEFLKNNEEIR